MRQKRARGDKWWDTIFRPTEKMQNTDQIYGSWKRRLHDSSRSTLEHFGCCERVCELCVCSAAASTALASLCHCPIVKRVGLVTSPHTLRPTAVQYWDSRIYQHTPTTTQNKYINMRGAALLRKKLDWNYVLWSGDRVGMSSSPRIRGGWHVSRFAYFALCSAGIWDARAFQQVFPSDVSSLGDWIKNNKKKTNAIDVSTLNVCRGVWKMQLWFKGMDFFLDCAIW